MMDTRTITVREGGMNVEYQITIEVGEDLTPYIIDVESPSINKARGDAAEIAYRLFGDDYRIARVDEKGY